MVLSHRLRHSLTLCNPFSRPATVNSGQMTFYHMNGMRYALCDALP